METVEEPQEEIIVKNYPKQKQAEFEKKFDTWPIFTEVEDIPPIFRASKIDTFNMNRNELNYRYPESTIIWKDEFGRTKEFIVNGLKNLVVTTENNSKLIKNVYNFPENIDKELFFAYHAGLPIYYDDGERKI